ncbi:ABC transporter related protein [Coriobacterium glomerans PW2]|uniref:ABC transporter related protein n=1 Tax=Coriobacterium glomerans (strain ATCC 49209 / DSM 20642 / JCM 10262 / PW2) TaxID=700015 RepID=F2N9C0_CORGP|nr:ABC transporter transmembrane domain-containing protein [Coriobacterium glomerans]AEB07868.1 ABC transporter related protein [Coriobacterium glomerans PW2]
MFRRFISYYRPQRLLFAADTVCALVMAGIDLAFPSILRALTGGLFTRDSDAITGALGYIAAGLICMYALRCGCRYFVSAQGHVMGARMESRMRQDLFDQYERFSFSYFDRVNSGDMMSRVVNDLFDICEAAHHVPEWIVICGTEIIGAFVILFLISQTLAAVMAAVTLIFVIVMVRQNLTMRAVYTDNRIKISEVNSQLQDSLAGMRVVKSFANEETERRKFYRSNDRYLGSKESMYKVMGTYQTTSALMTGSLYTIIVVLGGYLVAQRSMSPVDMATFALYITLFTGPIETLVNSTEVFQKAIAGFRRMDEVLESMPEIKDRPGATDLVVRRGAIEYRDVSFSYENREISERGHARPVIDHMNLAIAPGETIALVGPSGGGKSTTCALLPRFYDVSAGAITIDGQDVRDVTQESLRRSIGLVQQDVYLFDGTIRDNIEYGRPGATDEEIADAARKANIHEFIESLEDGYDTVVGERGGRLSGGQKQRIAIARVFLKDPAILILDEATSALDNESEEAVQDSLEHLAENRTTVIIAHRLSTIKHADEIVTVEHGQVVERGTHEELLARGGTYARYYRMQFEGVRMVGKSNATGR